MKIFQKYKVRLMKQMKSKQKIQNQETLTWINNKWIKKMN